MHRISFLNALAAILIAAAAGLTAQGAAAQVSFSADYTPANVPLGGTSRLELTIDNSAGANSLFSLNVTSTLPAGLMIADPANLVNDCPVTVTAVAGTGTIQTQPGGFIPLGPAASCTVGVDVIGSARGSFNTEAKVTYNETGVGFVEKTAAASLNVTGSGALQMVKAFTDDPVGPGETATLEFTLSNTARGSDATGVGFTDDLSAMLAGTTLDSVGLNTCGASVTGGGTGLINVSGGTVAAGRTCTITVSVLVPTSGSGGTHTNTVSDLSGTIGGAPVTGPAASARLTVYDLRPPELTKTFSDSQVDPGDPVTMTFTLTNPNTTNSLTGIAFTDDMGAFISGTTITALPLGGACGGSVFGTYSGGADTINLVGGSLPQGDSCSFTVDIQLPSSVPPGDYVNTTSAVTALDGPATIVGRAASATLKVGGSANLTFRKEFSDTAALAGDTVQLTFSIKSTPESSDATALSFTDNLGDAGTSVPPVFLAGTTIQSIDSNSCGTASGAGTGVFQLSGGTLIGEAECAIVLTLQLPSGAAPGSYTNSTSRLGFTAGTATSVSPATATLQIKDFRDLVLEKAFIDGPALPGGTATMRFTIRNPTSEAASSMAFSDNLSAFISGATAASPLPATPCGAGSSLSGSSTLILNGGSLVAGGTCSFDVQVSIPGTATAGSYTNQTGNMAYTLAGAPRSAAAATARLRVIDAALSLFKTFTDDPVSAGGTVTLEYRLDNLSSQPVTGLSFTDDFGAALSGLVATGLPRAGVCGSGSNLAGTSTLSLTGGTISGGGSCTFSVTLDVPASASGGIYPGTTSAPTGTIGGSGVTGSPASDSLTVRDATAPSIAKSFANGGAAAAGGTTTLDFTLTNNDASAPVSNLRFTDDLNAMLPGAAMTGTVSNDCGAAVSGGATIAVTGAQMAAGASCTIRVSVGVPSSAPAGDYTNTTSALMDAGGTVAAAATDTLRVQPAPAFSKAFNPAATPPETGQPTPLTFTIDNSGSTLAADAVSLTDTFPASMIVADPANLIRTGNCSGGSVSATPGAGAFSYTGGSVTAGTVCEITLDVTTTAGGSFVNTTSDLTSSLGNSGTASATLNAAAAAAPTILKTFSAAAAEQGEALTMTITLTNPNSFVPIGSVALSDTFGAGLEISTAATLDAGCVGGTLTGGAGDTALSYTGGTIPAGGTCTVSAGVTVTGASLVTNTADVTSQFNAAPVSSTATLSVSPAGAPTILKTFSAAAAEQGEALTMTITLTNPNSFVPIGSVALSDTFGAGLEISTAATLDAGCVGGTLTGGAGDTALSYTGGTIPAGGTCTVSAGVTVTGASLVTNTADVTSQFNAAPVSSTATLSVSPAGAPLLTKAFSAPAAEQGGSVTLDITVTNNNTFKTAGNVAVTDSFPAGLVIDTAPITDAGCTGGTLTGDVGDTAFGYSGGTVGAQSVCTISVGVTVTGNADITNAAFLTSDLNTLPIEARASLTITPAAAPVLTKGFSAAAAIQGETLTMTLAAENPNAAFAIGNVALTDSFPAGLVIAGAAAADAGCTGGTLTGAAGDTALAYTGGTITPGATCTLTVPVTVTGNADLTNTASVTSDLNAAAIDASASLTVTPAAAPVLTKSFSAAAAIQGETLSMTLAAENPNAAFAIGNVALTDSFPAGLVIAGAAAADAGCTGGTLTGAAGDTALAYTGGTIAPGATCTLTVPVTVTGNADLTNTASVTSDLNAAAIDASASLTVTPAPPPAFAKAYNPATILEAATTRASYTIDNAAALVAAGGLAFADRLDASITIANPPNITNTCAGASVGAAAGSSDLTVSGGTLPAGASCRIGVDLTAAVPGTFAGPTGPLTSTLGSSGTARATLTVLDNPTGEITIVQRADPDGSFGFASDMPALNFRIDTTGGEGRFGPVTLPAGTYDIAQSLPEGFGNVAMRCSDADSRADARARSLRIVLDRDESVTCTIASIQTDEKTVETINKFLFRRADLVLSSEPSLSRRIDRLLRGFGNASALRFANGDLMAFSPFQFDPMTISSRNVAVGGSLLSMRQAAASLKLAHGATSDTAYVANYRWDAWFEAQYKKFDDSQGEGNFGILYFGADYLVNENLLVGIMGQVDRLREDSAANNTSASGSGWMAGPYMTARLAPNLFFDARLAAGRSVNDISPFNTYTDSFDTTRWMAMMNLTGDFQRGAWSIRPNASLAYYEEKQEAYTDTLGVPIPSQTIGLTQLKLGPTFVGRFEDGAGTRYEPSFSLEAIYNMGTTMGVTLDDPNPHSEGWRGRAQAGIKMTTEGGASFGFGASFDGLFRGDYESIGLSLDVSIPLSKPVAR